MGVNSDLFSIREKLRQARSWGGVFHLISVALAIVFLVVAFGKSQLGRNLAAQDQRTQSQHIRQALIEALDRVVRYEHYHHEVYGRFTRDIYRLGLPEKLTRSSLEDVRRYYEISVVEMAANRIHIMAVASGSAASELSLAGDRVVMDEHYRVHANFSLPEPSRAYLIEDADRKIRNHLQGKRAYGGVYADYWKIEELNESRIDSVVAVGQRGVVLGERHSWAETAATREPASVARPEIFQSVRDRLRSRVMVSELENQVAKDDQPKDLRVDELRTWLEQVRLAQHIHRRERGRYARRWEELEAISGLRSPLRVGFAKNLKVLPIELPLGERAYRVVVEGTSGDLLGEQFILDESGVVRQVRYSDALARGLQRSTEILQDALNFQVEEIPSESSPRLDTPKTRPVQ